LLAFGREVEQRGGDEVGSLEDLEVALGGVVALGAVDDGFGCFVPGDFLSESVDGGDGTEFPVGQLESDAEGVAEGLIRPPRMAGSPFGLRLRLRPKRLRSLGVFRWRYGRGG
jgi:hypothetical protein